MNKIMIIGSPGSGKSTLARRLGEMLNYPVLHLDKIYHIDNNTQISKEAFKEKIKKFVDSNEWFIIDGNYNDTIEFRMDFVDTVIAFDIDPEICLENIEKRRLSEGKRPDMAEGFDDSVDDPDFKRFVKTFKKVNESVIERLQTRFDSKKFYVIQNYEKLEDFIDNEFGNNIA